MSGHPKPAATVQFDSFVVISVEWLRGQGSGLCPLFVETDDACQRCGMPVPECLHFICAQNAFGRSFPKGASELSFE